MLEQKRSMRQFESVYAAMAFVPTLKVRVSPVMPSERSGASEAIWPRLVTIRIETHAIWSQSGSRSHQDAEAIGIGPRPPTRSRIPRLPRAMNHLPPNLESGR